MFTNLYAATWGEVGKANTAGGAILFVNSQKNKCLSPKNLYLEKAYAAGKAADTEIIVLKTV